MKTIKFDKLKRDAVRQFADGLFLNYRQSLFNGVGAMLALQFMRYAPAQRAEFIAFADAFDASPDDEIAARAKEHQPFAMMTLHAREQGIREIDRWDVRQVGVLLKHFPNLLPKRLQGKSCNVRMADEADSPWVVEFAD